MVWAEIECTLQLGTIHLRCWQIFTIFDPYPPTIGIPEKCLWRGFLILMYCDLLPIGTWGHPSPPKTCWRLKWMVPKGDPYEMTNINFVRSCSNFPQFSIKKSKQIAKIWILELKKQKFGPTMQFPERLEDTPFNWNLKVFSLLLIFLYRWILALFGIHTNCWPWFKSVARSET